MLFISYPFFFLLFISLNLLSSAKFPHSFSPFPLPQQLSITIPLFAIPIHPHAKYSLSDFPSIWSFYSRLYIVIWKYEVSSTNNRRNAAFSFWVQVMPHNILSLNASFVCKLNGFTSYRWIIFQNPYYPYFPSSFTAAGNLLCFHFLSIVNSAVTDLAKQVSLEWNIESFGSTVRSCITESYGIFNFSLVRIFHINFEIAVPVCYPTNSELEGLPLLTFMWPFLGLRHSYWSKMDSQNCFDLHFSNS